MSDVNWSNYDSWFLVLPPNRPSESILLSVSDALSKSASNEHACILGSTPEFRTFCSRRFRKVTIIDKSEEFHKISSSLCNKNINENVLFGDWLEILSKFQKEFDVVLSHLTHGNIQFEKRELFFKSISSALKSDGVFVDYIFQPISPGYSLKKVSQIFKNKPLNLRTINDFNSIAIFQSDLINEIGCVNTSKIYKYLESSAYNSSNLDLIIAKTKIITPENNIWDYSFELTPKKLGYEKYFLCVSRNSENEKSPFYKSAYLQISKKLTC